MYTKRAKNIFRAIVAGMKFYPYIHENQLSLMLIFLERGGRT
jgi:hypothetical protein